MESDLANYGRDLWSEFLCWFRNEHIANGQQMQDGVLDIDFELVVTSLMTYKIIYAVNSDTQFDTLKSAAKNVLMFAGQDASIIDNFTEHQQYVMSNYLRRMFKWLEILNGETTG